jgi:hypothetical protein
MKLECDPILIKNGSPEHWAVKVSHHRGSGEPVKYVPPETEDDDGYRWQKIDWKAIQKTPDRKSVV